jgi:hypothetical protein
MPYFPIDPPAFEDVAKPSKPTARSRTEARRLKTDGQELDYEIDHKGLWVGGTAIEQGMTLSLLVRQGSIGSNPRVGNTLHETEIGAPSTAQDVRDRVMNSYPLSRYVADQMVEIRQILHEELDSGLKVSVEYKDLTTDENRTAFYGT